MARETEIKLRVTDLGAFRRVLAKLGARNATPGSARVHEQNMVFDTRGNQLKNRGQLLRIRTESPASADRSRKRRQDAKLTFKAPVVRRSKRGGGRNAHKVREELELQVSDGEALAKIFAGLGMRPWFRYEKFRTTYRLPKAQRWAKDLVIDLDETPIGTFVELEGPPRAIDRAAKALGYARRDYIVTNYFVLYRAECRRRGHMPGDMRFAPGEPRR
jgi:adenylate cyclase class 2